ncbi:MAG: dihydroxyacetone kinase subunit L [Planctomycetes bacterium]|nr:dihydroxyacetone kinase subunit L [Planctomycetota bacterium]
MPETIDYDGVVRMLRGAAEKVTTHHGRLSELDAVLGDGDHGADMRRAMAMLAKAIAENRSRDIASVLSDVGWAVIGAGGGAAGPLFGTFFMGMAEAASTRATLDAPALAAVFSHALAAVRRQTKAEPGDKTLLDALVPAVGRYRAAADAGHDVSSAMEAAADAAEKGAEATCAMQARFGLAADRGEASVGTVDPGAASVGLMFRGFADALAAAESE